MCLLLGREECVVDGKEGRVAMPLCLCYSSVWAGRRLHTLTPTTCSGLRTREQKQGAALSFGS